MRLSANHDTRDLIRDGSPELHRAGVGLRGKRYGNGGAVED